MEQFSSAEFLSMNGMVDGASKGGFEFVSLPSLPLPELM